MLPIYYVMKSNINDKVHGDRSSSFSVRIFDLAEQMIQLSGKLPEEEIEIKITELLPGEKPHESLHSENEQLADTSHSKIRRVEGCGLRESEWEKLDSEIMLIRGANDDTALDFLRKFVPHFRLR